MSDFVSVLLGEMASLTTSTKMSNPETSEIAGHEKNNIPLEKSGHVEHAVQPESAVKDDTSDGKIVWTFRSSVAAVSLCALYVGSHSIKTNCKQNDPVLTIGQAPKHRFTLSVASSALWAKA